MTTSRIIDLRQLLAERFPQETLLPGDQLVSGIPPLDTALYGGLPKSALTEVTSAPRSAGSASLIAALLQHAARERFFIALIDGRDSFDPQSIGPAALPHLLWVRCRKATEAIQAADLLLRDGNFPLVILDLVLNPLAELRKIPSSNWYRLQRLVEPAPTAFLVLTPRSMISSAHWKLLLNNRWMLEQLETVVTDLLSQLEVEVQRAQPNKWRNAPEIACAG